MSGIALEFVEPFAFQIRPDGENEACVVVKSSLVRELIASGDWLRRRASSGTPTSYRAR
jgi:hypothetical protein